MLILLKIVFLLIFSGAMLALAAVAFSVLIDLLKAGPAAVKMIAKIGEPSLIGRRDPKFGTVMTETSSQTARWVK